MTTSYKPQANGLVERSHRQLKDALYAGGAGVDWPAHLPWVLLGLRAAPKEVSGISSAEAVFGQPLVMPGDVISSGEAGPTTFWDKLASPEPPRTSQPRMSAEVMAGFMMPLVRRESFRKSPLYTLPLASGLVKLHTNRCTFKIALTYELFETLTE